MAEDRRVGRPPGRSEKGEKTRDKLYKTALGLFEKNGYEQTTLRQIAKESGVSVGLLYKYFDGKSDVVLTMQDELSARMVELSADMPKGTWRERATFALRTSMSVVGPHRDLLVALIPVLVSNTDSSLFAPGGSELRTRVQAVFVEAVVGAKDAPKSPTDVGLGNLLYMMQLGVILWWLLDQSKNQQATNGLIDLLDSGHRIFDLAVKFGLAKDLIGEADQLVKEALLGNR